MWKLFKGIAEVCEALKEFAGTVREANSKLRQGLQLDAAPGDWEEVVEAPAKRNGRKRKDEFLEIQ